MAKAEERLMEWLRDAHAAEEQAETMLSSFADRLEHYPELKDRVTRHVKETQRQAEEIKKCIERRNGSTSAFKVAGAKAIGLGQALSGIFVGDEVMKGALASRAFEAMEITSYTILVKTAQQVGDTETATVCGQILREEEAMAKWLDEHIESLTANYLQREEAGVTAKH
ncbi:ferritin-like domain-containing protein [Taklimakanibacter deserti]|uniref:ferritin-like domain-containing protein n=1 Tax=Taklimakanibacter deserti TaxID=2267839 RepID=UPI000E648700